MANGWQVSSSSTDSGPDTVEESELVATLSGKLHVCTTPDKQTGYTRLWLLFCPFLFCIPRRVSEYWYLAFFVRIIIKVLPMEVIARNLPEGMTERYVKQFFTPHLEKFGILIYHCHKAPGKTFANLTFTNREAGTLFLQNHGQKESGRVGFASVRVKLYHFRKPVYVSESYHVPDRFLLSSLESEEYKLVATYRNPMTNGATTKNTRLQRSFDVCQIRCGQWGYNGQHLVFFSHFQQETAGQILFGRRYLLIKYVPKGHSTGAVPNYQIEIPYGSIQSFTIGKTADITLTFSLAEAPKLYEVTEETLDPIDLTHALQRLGFQAQESPNRKPSIKRNRIAALNRSHEVVVSSCLCYRVTLSHSGVLDAIQGLKRAREIPSSIRWNSSTMGSIPFTSQMSLLNNALAGKKFEHFPFGLKFQLQKLAQNGCLSPATVVAFMDIVANHSQGISTLTNTKAVRRMMEQIPFAGPEIEAAELSLEALTDIFVQNQQDIARESSYSSAFIEQPEHICDIYKATVTPAGVYLYGPEPEIKNRILRKYSDHTSFFLQVSFLDENNEPIRYDRHTSNDDIYHGRFQKILEGIINVAGRAYEFLGFSHSSLRAQTCYYMAPFTKGHELLHARLVIMRLGDFSQIRSPAKCAARSK